ncbi:MAG: HAD family hydrolase [Bacillati bacterium ANGP1]|uniref:HAD family hydrolase n=1 Tax=Candidatus Segetimicrobium genomatis TaxID=2569760 RepID=A0A537K6P1_9BACT|nr:MAG: HAD family hydrolase [Terrabacteria group bacterium ANGP1]
MSLHGVIFDLGSTLIHRTGLELENEKCGALAEFARAEWGCRDPQRLAARLLEIRLDGWRRSKEELVERLATHTIAQAFKEAGLPTDDATLGKAEAVFFKPEVRVSRLYPGAVETLDALRGMGLRLGMISNATSHRLILDITARHRIDGYFDPLVTSAGFGRVKPHPSIFTFVLDAWQAPAGAVVMVGDTLGADILGAHQVGMRSILVDIEPNPANATFTGQAAPTARVTALEEIPRLVRRWTAGG